MTSHVLGLSVPFPSWEEVVRFLLDNPGCSLEIQPTRQGPGTRYVLAGVGTVLSPVAAEVVRYLLGSKLHPLEEVPQPPGSRTIQRWMLRSPEAALEILACGLGPRGFKPATRSERADAAAELEQSAMTAARAKEAAQVAAERGSWNRSIHKTHAMQEFNYGKRGTVPKFGP